MATSSYTVTFLPVTATTTPVTLVSSGNPPAGVNSTEVNAYASGNTGFPVVYTAEVSVVTATFTNATAVVSYKDQCCRLRTATVPVSSGVDGANTIYTFYFAPICPVQRLISMRVTLTAA